MSYARAQSCQSLSVPSVTNWRVRLRGSAEAVACRLPTGTLNHKYTGENAIRSASSRYCVIRSTGLTSEDTDTQFLLEAAQGDRISGKISRAEVADLIVAALGTPSATGETRNPVCSAYGACDVAGTSRCEGDPVLMSCTLLVHRV